MTVKKITFNITMVVDDAKDMTAPTKAVMDDISQNVQSLISQGGKLTRTVVFADIGVETFDGVKGAFKYIHNLTVPYDITSNVDLNVAVDPKV